MENNDLSGKMINGLKDYISEKISEGFEKMMEQRKETSAKGKEPKPVKWNQKKSKFYKI